MWCFIFSVALEFQIPPLTWWARGAFQARISAVPISKFQSSKTPSPCPSRPIPGQRAGGSDELQACQTPSHFCTATGLGRQRAVFAASAMQVVPKTQRTRLGELRPAVPSCAEVLGSVLQLSEGEEHSPPKSGHGNPARRQRLCTGVAARGLGGKPAGFAGSGAGGKLRALLPRAGGFCPKADARFPFSRVTANLPGQTCSFTWSREPNLRCWLQDAC